jgi:hypothetical protein
VEISNNRFANQRDEGMVCYRVNSTRITGNEFVNHAKEAIKVTSAGNTYIGNNTITAAATGETDGPLINVGTDVFDATITGNTCVKGNIGIGVEKGWRRISISENNCVGQGTRGIGASVAAGDTADDCSIVGNTVSDSGGAGILIAGLKNASIGKVAVTGNSVTNAGTAMPHHGIGINFVAEATIQANRIRRTTKHGVSVANNTLAVIADNDITETGQHGIRVEDSARVVTVSGNTISRVNANGGRYDGISIGAVASADLHGNRISDPERHMRYGIDCAAVIATFNNNVVEDAQAGDYHGTEPG